jgi:hypothetical protein
MVQKGYESGDKPQSFIVSHPPRPGTQAAGWGGLTGFFLENGGLNRKSRQLYQRS